MVTTSTISSRNKLLVKHIICLSTVPNCYNRFTSLWQKFTATANRTTDLVRPGNPENKFLHVEEITSDDCG